MIIDSQFKFCAGEIHRKQRKMMNPAFSTAHMRNLTPIFYTVTRKVFVLNLRLSLGLTVIYSYEML